MARKRLDILLVERGLAPTREKAQGFILAGEVWSGEKRLEKPGQATDEALPLEVRFRGPQFASRGGHKLEHALDNFAVPVAGRVCMDIGASTGGFTDCLLKRGAEHVFAVDVGYGQLEAKLRNHAQVTNLEKTNARYLKKSEVAEVSQLIEKLELVVMDVSFVSLRTLLPPLKSEFPHAKDWVLLFKPQFEMGQKYLKKGGIVRPEAPVDEALAEFSAFMASLSFRLAHGPESSPLTGKKSGNLEYLLHYELIQT